MERLPTGGVVSTRRIDTARVYSQQGASSIVAMACEIIVLLFFLYFTWILFKKLFHQRLSYFTSVWNLVDLLIVIFAWFCVTLYFIQWISIRSVMESLEANPFVYVNFQVIMSWSELSVYMIAFVVFLTTLKFLRLMRFNRQIYVLNRTVVGFVRDIGGLFLSFVIVLISFAQFTNLIFGSSLQDFSTIIRSIVALFNALLGKSYYWEFNKTHRLLGPLLYGLFALMMTVYTMNIVVAVLCETYETSEEESRELKNDDMELAAFMMVKFRRKLGLSEPKLPPPASPRIDISKKSIKSKMEDMETRLDILQRCDVQIQKQLDRMDSYISVRESDRVAKKNGSALLW